MTTWFESPKELVRADRVSQFWPNSSKHPADRVNAASRFIIYATCVLYLIRRDVRIFVLAATCLGVLYAMFRNDMVTSPIGYPTTSGENDHFACEMPTPENPMQNLMMHEYTDKPNRKPACYYPTVKPFVDRMMDDTFKFGPGRSRTPLPEHQRRFAARQFVTAPVSTLPGDQTAFAEALYGTKGGPLCRSHPEACSPNMRGTQLEAFSGLHMSGARR